MIIYIHYICLVCRRCAKRPPRSCYDDEVPLKCAQCASEMICVGECFTAPPRRADGQWKKLQWMIENGWRGNNWPVTAPMNLSAVQEALRENQELGAAKVKLEKEAISFERARTQARWNFRRTRTARRRERLELEAQQKYQDAVLSRVKSE